MSFSGQSRKGAKKRGNFEVGRFFETRGNRFRGFLHAHGGVCGVHHKTDDIQQVFGVVPVGARGIECESAEGFSNRLCQEMFDVCEVWSFAAEMFV